MEAKLPPLPDDLTVDDLVASWLTAQKVSRLMRMKKIMDSGPPTTDTMAEVTQIMVEVNLLSKLIKEADDGIISFGAKRSGITELTIGDSPRFDSNPGPTAQQLKDKLQELKDTLGLDMLEELLGEDAITRAEEAADALSGELSSEEATEAEETSSPGGLEWSFK